jgi:hypothetical protein
VNDHGARVAMIIASLRLLFRTKARTGNETQRQCNAMQLNPFLLIDDGDGGKVCVLIHGYERWR